MDRIRTSLPGFLAHLGTPILMCADVLSLSIAMVLSLFLRFDGMYNALEPGHPHVIVRYLYPIWPELLITLAIYIGCFAAFRLYRYAWRFASLEMIWGVVFANNLGLFALVLLMKLTGKLAVVGFPRGVFIIFWVLSILLVGGMRILLRLANMSRTQGQRALFMIRRDTRPKRAIILGGGSDGARVLAALHEDVSEVYDVIGFLDDKPQKRGIYIRGVRVLGPLNHLYKLLAEAAVDEVLIAIPDASGADMHDYVLACRRKQIPVKVIPGLQDVLARKAQARLEEISIEDLLRRQPVCIDLTGIGHYLTGKRVMITGAGGSIGSEICRQIAALEPEALILFGHGENSIHNIQQELTVSHPLLSVDRVHMPIGSVADDVRVAQIFQQYRPQVVFHAAAHKHVPIMELNVPEAVQNNVMGTRCIADACGRSGVERMVLISTDKAANPSSVMGATKWLCEQVLRALAETYPQTSYVTVRFGNVLGSRGSVVPIFREQIRRGGPVTITHPEVTRFFMTIPEAVQLVLQAGAIGSSGGLFLLDMGTPVKIVDLARDMIRLSGLEPDIDIKIHFTGLRPGEKLHEVLTNEEEILEPASSEGLSLVHRGNVFTPAEFKAVLRRLQQLVSSDDPNELLRYLVETVPGYANQRLITEVIDTADKSAAIPSQQ